VNLRKILLIVLLFTAANPIYKNSYALDGWMVYQTFINTTFHDITFADVNTGWAVGNTGVIVKTTNGGNSWVQQNSGTTTNLFSVSFLNENTGWVAGGDVNLFTFSHVFVLGTTNGGSSWDTLFNNHLLNTHLQKVYLQNSMGYILGKGGNGGTTEGFLLKTTNFGMNWTSSPSPDYKNYFDIVFKNNNMGWLLTKYSNDTGGDTASVFRSSNGGVTWSKMYTRNFLNIYDVHYFDNENILCYGQSFFPAAPGRFILRSSNGGQNWDSTYGPVTGNYWESDFIDFNTGWAVGTSGIYKTTNGGANFELQLNNPTHSIHFYNSLTGWVGGNNGIIYKTISGGVTGINPISSFIPNKPDLFQNYPNPFNPSTLIKFDIVRKGNVKVFIYDNTGRLIENIINQSLSPGTYGIQWNAGSYPSGVYFCRLETEDFLQSKKMLLIK